METMIVYYSLDGNTKLLVQAIAKELKADTLELKMKKALPEKGFGKFFFGGKGVVFKETPEILYEKTDFSRYDNFIFASPVWAGGYASPFNTFFKLNSISGKKVALLACYAGGGAEKCFAGFHKALAGNQIVGQVDFINPLKTPDESIKKAIAWAQGLAF